MIGIKIDYEYQSLNGQKQIKTGVIDRFDSSGGDIRVKEYNFTNIANIRAIHYVKKALWFNFVLCARMRGVAHTQWTEVGVIVPKQVKVVPTFGIRQQFSYRLRIELLGYVIIF